MDCSQWRRWHCLVVIRWGTNNLSPCPITSLSQKFSLNSSFFWQNTNEYFKDNVNVNRALPNSNLWAHFPFSWESYCIDIICGKYYQFSIRCTSFHQNCFDQSRPSSVSSLWVCLDRQDVREERHFLCQEAGEEDSGEPEQENPLLQPGDREAPQTVSADSGQSVLSLYSVISGFLRTLVKEPR